MTKYNFIFCLTLLFFCGWIKADDSNNTYDVVEELNANDLQESYSHYGAITNQNIHFASNTFAVRTTNLDWMTAAEYKRLKLSGGKTRFSTPLGSKDFVVASLTDSTKIPPGGMRAHFVVRQDGQPKWQFDLIDFQQFDAEWIDEKTIKIVSWPGRRVRVAELINIETGKIVYRSADGIFDSLKNQPSVK